MNVWGWIILYVVLFVGLQLLIYRYLRSDDDAAVLTSTPSGSDGHVPDDIRRDRILEEFNEGETNSDVRVCPHCGTENGVGYTFCRECIGTLGVW